VVDIHCVTTWSKFDTRWRGVTVDDLLAAAGVQPPTPWILAHSLDGYSTNVPLADRGRACLGGDALRRQALGARTWRAGPPAGAAPVLLEVGQVGECAVHQADEAGFWELRGYHMRGDPFKEERYG
jgi:DMSO/TMAO reductase YedYZ molybdopterin-dependent catalytic subunit